jgi:hypothetical protein
MCRWLERDPAGYQDGPSLYSYLGRNPMAGTDPFGLFYSGSGITVIAPDQIRPPVGASELVNPPGYGLRPTLLPPGMPGNNEVLAWAEALSAIARTNAERGVDNGLGFWDSLLLSDSPLHLTLQSIGFIPGLGEPVDVIDGIIYALEGDTVNAGISFSAAIPGIGWGATSARWGKRAADIADKANDARKAAVVGEAAAKSARTTHKSWPSARAAYWKAFGPGGKAPKREVRVRFRDGTVDTITQTKELHHRVARRDGGTHDFDNLMEVWPDEHALREIDPHRHTGYEVLEVLSGP